MNTKLVPPDQSHRQAILEDLDSTILVEAAAGTGKTTSIVGRMVRLLAAGVTTVDKIAAVTFTRKAAAELADRFRKALQAEALTCDAPEKHRLERAILSLDRCFVGTIHSFCGRLLRERPLEAGLPIDFQEIDELEDRRIRSRVWGDFVEQMYESKDPAISKLEELGIEPEDLTSSFQIICDYQDVEEWPVQKVDLPDLEPAISELREMLAHIEPLIQEFPDHIRKDDLMAVYERVVLAFRQARDIHSHRQFMDILSQFKATKRAPKTWPWGSEHSQEEQQRLKDFTERVASPLLKRWRQYRYGAVMPVLLSAMDYYRSTKLRSCKLNFQDLLLYTAQLLEKNPRIREHFKKRFTHVLVDEFQDTDPIQAQVLMYLTADDPCETDWRKCRPVPGALFVVGDPKQSIYRFRRADIITYEQVKEIVRQSGGRIITLSGNFRTIGPLIDWINSFFRDRFDELPRTTSPLYVALQKVIDPRGIETLGGIRVIRITQDKGDTRSVTEQDAYTIAAIIRNALDQHRQIPIKLSDKNKAAVRAVEPGDFLIITPRLKHLHFYAKALQDFEIPYEVTGSSTVNKTEEVLLLYSVIHALVEPHNPVPLLGVLRGPLFGVSDSQLYDFKKKGGTFSFYSQVPENLDRNTAEILSDAFSRLRTYRSWLMHLPMMSALDKIVDDLGLLIRASLGSGGNLNAGAVFKAIEWLRKSSGGLLTTNDLMEALHALVSQTETHDAIPAMTMSCSAVRLMNLHKVKGLEAPIVFLADPSGSFEHQPLIHIDRTGDKVSGYFAAHTVQARGNRAVIFAEPSDWEHYAERESHFDRAEFLRLLYVAATRAGCLLTISQLDKSRRKHPWVMFSEALKEASEWSGSFQQKKAEVSQPEEIPEHEVLRVKADIAQMWKRATSKSYQTSGVKARTVISDDGPSPVREHGTLWGTVIHSLLEKAMAGTSIDMEQAALSALAEIGLEPELLEMCTDTVWRAMKSDLWARAKQSPKVMVETPFQMLVTDVGNISSEKPLILKGVIDLVFQEDDGWVLVDYKTDRIPTASLEQLVEKYRGQVLAYAQAWASITQQCVKEKGLYFTHIDSYVVLD